MKYRISVADPNEEVYNRNPWKQGKHKKRDPMTKEFIAWDSEGYTDPDTGEHRMMLFGCSTGEHIMGADLDFKSCFDLMLNVAAKSHANHVIYAGGYDVIMMIRKFPTVTQQRIVKGLPTWYQGYRIEYRKAKYLMLGNGKHNIVLYDVFTFFSTSFVNACREYLPPNPDFDAIAEIKLQRSTFTLDHVKDVVVPYWKQELKYLVELCTILRQRLYDAGILPSRWHGPGAVASTVLTDKGMRSFMATLPDGVNEAARYAYFGGRFEQFKMGQANHKVYQCDIRSAYPYAISWLPPIPSDWRYFSGSRKRILDFALYRVSYRSYAVSEDDLGTMRIPGPFPWRARNGAIFYPHNIASGWYWGIEVKAALDYAPGKVTILEGWEPRSVSYERPFQWIERMYNDRAAMKKAGNPTQLALKLAMNSIYGKLAQSKGAKVTIYEDGREPTWKLPPFHQIEWAGYITASTRAYLYRAMRSISTPDRIIAVETDAVYCDEMPSITVSGDLGMWEVDELDDIMYIQSGVYFKRTGDKWSLKSRGFEPRNHTYETWLEAMRKLPQQEASVTSRTTRFGSIPGRDTFATWYQSERTTNIISQMSKRVHVGDAFCMACLEGKSLADGMHEMYVPEVMIDADVTPSAIYKLPWFEGIPNYYEEEELITEAGYTLLDFDLSQLGI